MNLSPSPVHQFFDNNGRPLVGGLLFTYEAGTSTPIATYSDEAGTPNTNPIELDFRGECRIWLDPDLAYKFVLAPKGDSDPPTRPIWTADNVRAAATLAEITQQFIGERLWPRTQSEIAAGITPADYAYPVGDLRRYGADPTGATSAHAALEAALQAGHTVLGGGRSCTYAFASMVTFTGGVDIDMQGATTVSDGLVLKVVDGGGSRVCNWRFMPATMPYTILRDPTSWTNVSADVAQSLDGYQPGMLDADIWAGLPTVVKNQTDGTAPINTGLWFTVSSAAGAYGLEVSGVTGYCASILVDGFSGARIHDNDFGSGGGFYGAIVLVNGVPYNVVNQSLGFTLPRGVDNKVYANRVRYASLCGIVVFGQDGHNILFNDSSFHGESGIKTYGYDGIGLGDSVGAISTRGRIVGNTTHSNYHDGHDLQVIYGSPPYAYHFDGSTVTGNTSHNNRHTGFTFNGTDVVCVGNEAYQNWTHGISAVGRNHVVANNVARENCKGGTGIIAQPFDIQCLGDSITAIGNTIYNPSAPATYNYIHYGIGGANPAAGAEGQDIGNYVHQGVGRMAVAPNIKGWGAKGAHQPGCKGSVTPGSFTYTINAGSWSLVGDRVFFTGHVAWSASSGHDGNCLIDISGIPFPRAADADDFGVVQISYQTWAGITGVMAGRIAPNSTDIILSAISDGATTDLTGAFPSSGELVFSGSYRIAQTN